MVSPISSRTNAQPLTLELLKEHVPHVKAGQIAKQELSDGQNLSLEEKQHLLSKQLKGSKSQEVLIISGLPLIKNIASKEFQRRKAWSSRITYDDVLQEAIGGFIRGLLSYDETTDHNSPINYLSMWVTTTIRRRVEALEHDFAIPYEVVERARRIRAVSSRLNNELSRGPTDEEILDALNTQGGGYGRNKWGTTEAPAPRSGSKKFTQKHLDEARQLNTISYGLQSYETPSIDNDESYEKASTPLTTESSNATEDFEEGDLSRSRLDFFNQAFMRMKIGSRQQDIILRFFGLDMYSEPQNQKDIILNTGHPARFVKSVITAFSTYMPQKGGVFHYLLLHSDPDLIEGLEMAWLLPILGEWPTGQKNPEPAPNVLTQTNTKTKS